MSENNDWREQLTREELFAELADVDPQDLSDREWLIFKSGYESARTQVREFLENRAEDGPGFVIEELQSWASGEGDFAEETRIVVKAGRDHG